MANAIHDVSDDNDVDVSDDNDVDVSDDNDVDVFSDDLYVILDNN